MASGSSALFVALAVAGVRPGDEVITTPYTFDATMEAIVLLDAVPVFVDIRPADLNIDPALIEAAITPRTRAIMPVHIFGAPGGHDAHPGDRRAPRPAGGRGHGPGLRHRLRGPAAAASYGRMSTLSFYPTKNLPGIGDGGMVFCRDAAGRRHASAASAATRPCA